MSIKSLIILAINTLLITVVLVLALTFYQQFKLALDERVMLQLTSIKRLKRVQIEAYLNREWAKFNTTSYNENQSESDIPYRRHLDSISRVGIYDLTYLNSHGQLTIGLIKEDENRIKKIKLLDHHRIQEILLERTGMGKSGETYLVGEDYHLRSKSRFFPEEKPYSIRAETQGVRSALSGRQGHGIFPDYRGIQVYSAFHPIRVSHINWVILSEIDVSEANMPLHNFRLRLIFIALVIVIIAILISLYFASLLSAPILTMQRNLQLMASGNYNFQIKTDNPIIEIQEMFQLLSTLQNSIAGAVDFSVDIGDMNLTNSYSPKSANDLLGQSLLKMRDKLVEFQVKESKNTLTMKKMLIEREEIERRRLAMELHDGIGPLLTNIKLYVQNSISDQAKKSEIKQLLDDIISEVRLISYDLMPPSLSDFGIGSTLKNFIAQINKSSEVNLHFEDLSLHEKSTISNELAINIFRICQELINNSIKHSGANKIVLTLTEFDSHISIFYFDNGKGYTQSKITKGAGLTNIQERVQIFNGTINFLPNPQNAIVEIELPMTNAEN